MTRYPVAVFLAFFLVSHNCSHAQTDSASLASETRSQSIAQTAGADGLTVLRAAGFIFSAPARWDGKDWIGVGATAGATAAAALLDDEELDLMNRNRNTLNDRLEQITVRYGEAWNVLFFSGGFYAVGLFTRNTWLRETGLLVGTSMLLSGAVSEVTKIVAGRARPYTGLGNHWYKPFTFTNDDYHSFPSGHTIVAFSASTVLARKIGNPWATVGLYALATGTALSRNYSRNHWLSDVVFAGILSTVVSNSVVTWYEQGPEGTLRSDLRVEPRFGGIALVWSF